MPEAPKLEDLVEAGKWDELLEQVDKSMRERVDLLVKELKTKKKKEETKKELLNLVKPWTLDDMEEHLNTYLHNHTLWTEEERKDSLTEIQTRARAMDALRGENAFKGANVNKMLTAVNQAKERAEAAEAAEGGGVALRF